MNVEETIVYGFEVNGDGEVLARNRTLTISGHRFHLFCTLYLVLCILFGFSFRRVLTTKYQAQNTKYKAQPLLRSEEHTSELQSRLHLVCRLLLEKKKKKIIK